MEVGPGAFYPRPRVDSVVLKLEFPETADPWPLSATDWTPFKRIVRAGFSQRRKTLANALLAHHILPDKNRIQQILSSLGLQPTVRAEELDVAHFCALTAAIVNKKPGS